MRAGSDVLHRPHPDLRAVPRRLRDGGGPTAAAPAAAPTAAAAALAARASARTTIFSWAARAARSWGRRRGRSSRGRSSRRRAGRRAACVLEDGSKQYAHGGRVPRDLQRAFRTSARTSTASGSRRSRSSRSPAATSAARSTARSSRRRRAASSAGRRRPAGPREGVPVACGAVPEAAAGPRRSRTRRLRRLRPDAGPCPDAGGATVRLGGGDAAQNCACRADPDALRLGRRRPVKAEDACPFACRPGCAAPCDDSATGARKRRRLRATPVDCAHRRGRARGRGATPHGLLPPRERQRLPADGCLWNKPTATCAKRATTRTTRTTTTKTRASSRAGTAASTPTSKRPPRRGSRRSAARARGLSPRRCPSAWHMTTSGSATSRRRPARPAAPGATTSTSRASSRLRPRLPQLRHLHDLRLPPRRPRRR